MKQLLAVFLVLLFYVSAVQPQKSVSQPTSQAGPDAASAELVTLTNSWNEAINANDRAKLEAFFWRRNSRATVGAVNCGQLGRNGWIMFIFTVRIPCTESPRGSTATLQL
jgi:hypothetical protein